MSWNLPGPPWRALVFMLTALVFVLCAPRAALPAGEIMRGTATAIDGDLLELDGRQLRLHAIDAPDAGQTCRTRGGREYDCGTEARVMLGRLLEGRETECEVLHIASDGRRVALCRIDGISIAGAMVLRGWAFAAERLAPDYARLQSLAQARRAGMWAGRVEAPWLWRSRRLEEEARRP